MPTNWSMRVYAGSVDVISKGKLDKKFMKMLMDSAMSEYDFIYNEVISCSPEKRKENELKLMSILGTEEGQEYKRLWHSLKFNEIPSETHLIFEKALPVFFKNDKKIYYYEYTYYADKYPSMDIVSIILSWFEQDVEKFSDYLESFFPQQLNINRINKRFKIKSSEVHVDNKIWQVHYVITYKHYDITGLSDETELMSEGSFLIDGDDKQSVYEKAMDIIKFNNLDDHIDNEHTKTFIRIEPY